MVFRQTIGLGNGDIIKFSKIDIFWKISPEKIMGLGYKKNGSLWTKLKIPRLKKTFTEFLEQKCFENGYFEVTEPKIEDGIRVQIFKVVFAKFQWSFWDFWSVLGNFPENLKFFSPEVLFFL